MASQNSGCGVKVLILILVFVAVLNSWEIWRLNGEVSRLESRLSSMKMRREAAPQSKVSKSALEKAYKHLAEAQQAIAKGDVKRGSTELDKSVRLAQKAYEDAAAPYSGAAERFQQSLQNTRDLIEKLQKSLNAKPHESGGGSKDE